MNKSVTYKIQEITNEVSCREKVESNNLAPTIGDADKEESASNVSSCEQVENSEVSACKQLHTASIVYRPRNPDNPNDLNERTTSVASKGSDKVASNHDSNNVYDGITNVQVSGLVDGIEPKELGTVSNRRTVHVYDKDNFTVYK